MCPDRRRHLRRPRVGRLASRSGQVPGPPRTRAPVWLDLQDHRRPVTASAGSPPAATKAASSGSSSRRAWPPPPSSRWPSQSTWAAAATTATCARLRGKLASQVKTFREAIAASFRSAPPSPNRAEAISCGSSCRADRRAQLQAEAARRGIAIAPGPIFAAGKRYKSHVRVNCGFPWSRSIADAVHTLGSWRRRLGGALSAFSVGRAVNAT